MRALAGAGLTLIASILSLVIFAALLVALIPPVSPVQPRLLIALTIGAVILTVGAAMLHEWSVLWQIPLRGFALAAIVVGVRFLVEALFRNWRLAFTAAGALSAGYVVLGFGAGQWMRQLQVSLLGHRRPRRPTLPGSHEARSVTDKSEPGSLKAMLHEFKSGTWYGNARDRATRRKSPWNLLLILALPLWLALWFGGVWLTQRLKNALLAHHPLFDWIWPSAIAPFFAYFPLLLGTIVPAMVLVNYFVYYLVPPALRAMDAEDQAFPGTEYGVQQPILVRLTLWTLPPAFLLALIGQIFI